MGTVMYCLFNVGVSEVPQLWSDRITYASMFLGFVMAARKWLKYFDKSLADIFKRKKAERPMTVSGPGVWQNKDNLVISRYSDLPRYFTINGTKYDFDDAVSIQNIPLFDLKMKIDGKEYQFSQILYRHYMQAAVSPKADDTVVNAAYKKYLEFRNYELSKQAPISDYKPEIRSDEPIVSKKESPYLKYGGVESELLNIDIMDGHAFEYWCADLLRKNGFINVSVTQGSGDHGVDILAQKEGIRYAVQCKCYSSDIGNKPIQEVSAGRQMPSYHCQIGAVMTNRHFTKGAKELAAATGTLLWDRDWIKAHLQSAESNEQSDDYTSRFNNELLPAAMDLVLETGQASVSMIERRLKVGYAMAARIIDEMEANGFVGPFQGSKPRAILITKSEWEKMKHP